MEPDKAKEEDLVVEIGNDPDELDLEIVDDTPLEDRNRPRRGEGDTPDIPTDEEIASYSAGVQKRIKQLKYEFHEERRAKEAALRESQEITRFGLTLKQQLDAAKAEAQRYKKMVEDGEPVLAEQATGRLEAQIGAAKRAYQDAYENGDAEKLAEVSSQLAALNAEKVRVNNFSDDIKRRRAFAQAEAETIRAHSPQQEQPHAPAPSRKAQEWVSKNSWFQVDPEMTGYAFGVHEKLVKSGVNPETEEYYGQIDKAMRKVFPDRFDDGREVNPSRPGNVVATADRVARTPRKVRLTDTQVRIAKRLGLTNEQYAKAMLEQAAKEAQEK